MQKEELRCPCCGEKLTLQMLVTLQKSFEDNGEPEGETPFLLEEPEPTPPLNPSDSRYIWNHIARLVQNYGWDNLAYDPSRAEWRDFKDCFARYYSDSGRLDMIASQAGMPRYDLPAPASSSIRSGKLLNSLSNRCALDRLFRAILREYHKESLVP